MNRLSVPRLTAILLCARFFSMMTYFPYGDTNTTVLMIAAAVSAVVQGIMLIPAAVLTSKLGKNPCRAALDRGKPLGRAVTAGFLLYFLWDIFLTSGNVAFFMDRFFSNRISRIPALICALVAAVYIGSHNSAVLGKCAGIALGLFVFFMAVLMASTLEQPDITNFHLAVPNMGDSLWSSVKGEFVRNRELVMLAFLLGDVRTSHTKTVYSFLVIKLAALELALGFVTLVLGDFALSTDMPLFYLSCLSNTHIVERYDAGFMAVWTVLAAFRLGALFHCCARCANMLLEKAHGKISAAVWTFPAIAAFPLLLSRRWKELAYYMESPWLIAVLAGLVPLVLLAMPRQRRTCDER